MAAAGDGLAARVLATLEYGWSLLPACTRLIDLRGIVLADLGARHGTYNPATGIITLNRRLFEGEIGHLPLYDIAGNSPPEREPSTLRALATWIHEAAHALGHVTGWDRDEGWLGLSGWTYDPLEMPQQAQRYTETRPGWAWERSDWYALPPTWFAREYSSKSPEEDFADAVTHCALGWTAWFTAPEGGSPAIGQAKRDYILDRVWGWQPEVIAVVDPFEAWKQKAHQLRAESRMPWRQACIPQSIPRCGR